MGLELKRTLCLKDGPRTEYGRQVPLPSNGKPVACARKMSENVGLSPEIREREEPTHSGCLENRQVEGGVGERCYRARRGHGPVTRLDPPARESYTVVEGSPAPGGWITL